jgi:hypothetical protein
MEPEGSLQHSLTTRNYCRRGINWMVVLIHLATDCSRLPATFQDIRFGIKYTFSSKIETNGGCDGLNLSHGSSTDNTFPFFLPFSKDSYE